MTVCVSVVVEWPDRLCQSVCRQQRQEPKQIQVSYKVTKEWQESGGPNSIYWGVFLYVIFLLFKLKVEPISTTTTLRASLCINQRASNLPYSWFQDPEDSGV